MKHKKHPLGYCEYCNKKHTRGSRNTELHIARFCSSLCGERAWRAKYKAEHGVDYMVHYIDDLKKIEDAGE